MANATTMYEYGPDDGWNLIAASPTAISISGNKHGAEWYVAVAAALPAASFVGEKRQGGESWIAGPVDGNVYVRSGNKYGQEFAVTV